MAVSIPQAGELKTVLQVYRQVQDALNFEPQNDTQNIEMLFQTWCKFEPVGAQLFYENAQLSNAVTHRMWVRFNPGKTDILTLTDPHILLCIEGVFYKLLRASDVDNHSFIMAELTALYTAKVTL